jgi:hypothetical protein
MAVEEDYTWKVEQDIIRIYKIQPDNFIYFSNAIKE